jgi:hypothetical protein
MNISLKTSRNCYLDAVMMPTYGCYLLEITHWSTILRDACDAMKVLIESSTPPAGE